MMIIFDVEIYRSKVGVKYFELIDTIKGLTLPQKNSLIGILNRMGIEYKIVTHSANDGGQFDMFGGFMSGVGGADKDEDDDDDDNFFDNFIKGID